MQKKIIALAIAAAFSAPAFADTTVYGIVDAAIASVSGTGQGSGVQAVSGGLAASRLGVKSVQDAGDMKVVAVLEYNLDTETSGSVGSARQQMLALAGGFGTFATGYLQTTGYDWENKFDPAAGSTVSPLQNVNMGNFLIGTKAVAARAPRALAYISPDMAGVTVAVNYTTQFTGTLGDIGQASGTQDKVTAYLVSATYNGGPLSVGGVIAKDSIEAGSTGEKTDYALGASYDFSVVKLFATYQSDKTTAAPGGSDVTLKAESISAVAPVGPGAVLFSYAKTSGVTDAGATGYTLGWLQGLSKTTTVYVAASKMNQDSGTRAYSVFSNGVANANLALGGSSTELAVGLQNKF